MKARRVADCKRIMKAYRDLDGMKLCEKLNGAKNEQLLETKGTSK